VISKEEIESVIQLLEVHPQGTHFCMTSKQPGYAFDNERTRDLCRLALWALESHAMLKDAGIALDAIVCLNGTPEAHHYLCRDIRETLAKFPKDEP